MRPVSWRSGGFRSFGTEPGTTIDFGDRELVAIIGDTGAGKSSVLEATYALYGQTSFAGHDSQEIVNDQSEHCRVELPVLGAELRMGGDTHAAGGRRRAASRPLPEVADAQALDQPAAPRIGAARAYFGGC